MTDHVDLEPVVRAFLRDREARRPDPTHVVRRVVGETPKVPQRRHWWQGRVGSGALSLTGDRRGRVVQPRLLFASLAVTSLLVVAAAFALVLSGSVVSRPASTAAPGAASVEEVMAGLATLESVDGVVRAHADGAGHELAGAQLVASNGAGDIWVFRDESKLFRLGRPGTESIEHIAPYPWAMAVAEDGSVWLSTSEGILSFDGSTWTGHQSFTDGVSRVDAARDGSVWATWTAGDDASGRHLTVGRYDGGGWTTWEGGADDGSFPVDGQLPSGFEVTPDGRAWLSFSGPETPGLVSFDGERWRIMPAGPGGRTSVEALEEGPNGTLWAILGSGPVPDEDAILATFDGEAWSVRSDEVPSDRREYGVDILVTDNEVLWLSRGLNRRGVHRFDASGWTQPIETESFLTERETMHLGPDGTVWVTGEAWRGSPPILIQPS